MLRIALLEVQHLVRTAVEEQEGLAGMKEVRGRELRRYLAREVRPRQGKTWCRARGRTYQFWLVIVVAVSAGRGGDLVLHPSVDRGILRTLDRGRSLGQSPGRDQGLDQDSVVLCAADSSLALVWRLVTLFALFALCVEKHAFVAVCCCCSHCCWHWHRHHRFRRHCPGRPGRPGRHQGRRCRVVFP